VDSHRTHQKDDETTAAAIERVKNAYLMGRMTFHAANFTETFVQYPPSQSPASLTIDQMEKEVEAQIKAMAKAPKTQ
jgi:arylsulfatase